MNRVGMAQVMEAVFRECQTLREAGQKEYAQDEDNAFRNFEWIGEYLEISRERVLMVYAMKHWDGIAAWVNGHRSQREDVRGRINDLIVYLCLLRGMVEEAVASNTVREPLTAAERDDMLRRSTRIE